MTAQLDRLAQIVDHLRAADAARAIYEISSDHFRDLLVTVFRQCGYDAPKIDEVSRMANATRMIPIAPPLSGNKKTQLTLAWEPVESRADTTAVAWLAINSSGGGRRPDRRATEQLGAVLENRLADAAERKLAAERDAPPWNPVLAPGVTLEGPFSGNLRDYSNCATAAEVKDLQDGILPLGIYAFGHEDEVTYGPPLHLGRYRTGEPVEYNGTLICASQNSGKTSLIVRWAEAANRAGYSIFLIDVKGNLRRKLESRLQGDVYCFSTDPRDEQSDRINFLAGLSGLTPLDTEKIQGLASALLPNRGWVGGRDEFHHRNDVVWLTALIHLLKLRQTYFPEIYVTGAGKPREADLCDLYELAADEDFLAECVAEMRDAEAVLRMADVALSDCGVDHWVREAAHLFHPEKVPGGQRDTRHSFRDYSQRIVTSLEPFSEHGTLCAKIRDEGEGRLFALEDLDQSGRQATIFLAAREQDLEKAETVLALAVQRLQHHLFERMNQPADRLRPVLLLLDETRRIRSFDANKYITYAREARAGCVVAYQSLDQIGDERKIAEVLENVGTQIYLGSLTGNTAKYFIRMLPRRHRAMVSEQITFTPEGRQRTLIAGKELVESLTTNELHDLPAGNWPALIYINSQPRRKPILTDMDEQLLSKS